MPELTRDEIIEAARTAAVRHDGPITRTVFIRETGISEHQINRHFPEGRWTEVRELAGIDRHPLDRKEYTDEECLAEYHRVVQLVGEIPTWSVYANHAQVSREKLVRTFGGLPGTLRAYERWLKSNDPDSPVLELIDAKSRHEIPTPPQQQAPSINQWAKSDGTVFGAPIDFRGLRHAPINEQGVVYLFGMVSYELGFIVEAVHAQFPDCEAKRCIGKDRWQRVRIEFEYRSVNFRDHGHDPSGADLIVCWEHNWAECPIEVLELRKAIDDLEG